MDTNAIKTPSARYSTREVAVRIFRSEIQTRILLKAAGVAHTKCGACWLWDAAGVERVIVALKLEEVRR